MICTHCGKENVSNNQFCQYCGQPMSVQNTPPKPPPQQPSFQHAPLHQPPKRKNLAAWILAAVSLVLAVMLVLMSVGVVPVGSNTAQGLNNPSFETPEDAIEHFIQCVKADDIEGALSACAIDEIASSYDFEAMIKRIECIPPATQYLPSEYKIYERFNQSSAQNHILRQLSYMALSVTLPKEYVGLLQSCMLTDNEVDFDNVVEDMNPQLIRDIEIVKIDQHHLLENETHQKNIKKQAKINGADRTTSRAVLYELNGDYYVGGFTLMEFDGCWKISTLQDVLINQSIFGILYRIDSKADFDKILNGTGSLKLDSPKLDESKAADEVKEVIDDETSDIETPLVLSSVSIGVSERGSESGIAAIMTDDIVAAAKNQGASADIQYAEYSIDTQMEQLENMIVAGADYVVCTAFSNLCEPTLSNAKDMGVDVIMVDSDNSAYKDICTASLEYDVSGNAGKLVDWLSSNVSGDVRICELSDSGSKQSGVISDGLHQAACSYNNISIDYVQECDWDDGSDGLYDLDFCKLRDCNVVFCHGIRTSLELIYALKDAGFEPGEDIIIVTAVGDEEITRAIKDGDIAASVVNDPKIGDILMDTILQIQQGTLDEKTVLLPSTVVDISNCDTF